MSLYVDPKIPRFTREELVAEMDSRFGYSDGAFRKYQELGLIAEPHQEGRWEKGKEGSAPALWSDNDRRMLLALLELRERHKHEVGGQLPLANLGNPIVWSWVFYDGYVSLDQARRALRTWVTPQLGGLGKGRARSMKRMSGLARQSVEQVAAPGVPLKLRIALATKLTDRLWADDVQGLRALVGDMEKVVDPNGTGRWVGAPGACVDAAGEIERLYLAHVGAQAVVTGKPPLSEHAWEEARQLLRRGWAGYMADQPKLAATATDPSLFVEPTVDHQVARCSATLLLVLGARIVDRDNSPTT